MKVPKSKCPHRFELEIYPLDKFGFSTGQLISTGRVVCLPKSPKLAQVLACIERDAPGFLPSRKEPELTVRQDRDGQPVYTLKFQDKALALRPE